MDPNSILPSPEPDPGPITFRPPRAGRRWAWLGVTVGGAALTACIGILATHRHVAHRGFEHIHEINALIVACASIVPAAMLFSAGVLGLRGPGRVTVGPDAIEIAGPLRRRSLAWPTLASAVVRVRARFPVGQATVIELVDHAGRRRATLPMLWMANDECPRDVQPGIDPADPDDPDVDGPCIVDLLGAVAARLPVSFGERDDRWMQRLAAVSMALMALVAAAAFVWGAYDWSKNARFATADGRTAAARLDDAYVLGSTPWVRYSFVDEHGRRFSRETTMHRRDWERVRGSPTIAIDHLRSDPRWSRLNAGESTPTLGPGWMLGSVAFFLFAAAGAAFLGLGYDFKLGEGEPGARLTRHGQVVWRSKTNAAAHEARQRFEYEVEDDEDDAA